MQTGMIIVLYSRTPSDQFSSLTTITRIVFLLCHKNYELTGTGRASSDIGTRWPSWSQLRHSATRPDPVRETRARCDYCNISLS